MTEAGFVCAKPAFFALIASDGMVCETIFRSNLFIILTFKIVGQLEALCLKTLILRK
jgi:hypothetical protein